MIITSDKTTVNASPATVFEFLSEAQNIYEILPKDKVNDFKATETGCSFKIQGGVTISLLYTGKIPHSRINMKSGDKAPFAFTLAIHLNDKGDDKTEGYLVFDGDVNVFMKMMIEKPLVNLFNYMSHKLGERF